MFPNSSPSTPAPSPAGMFATLPDAGEPSGEQVAGEPGSEPARPNSRDEQLPPENRSRKGFMLPPKKLAIFMAVMSVVAIGITAYLGWVALTSSKIAGCGGGQVFDCNDVINSRWSRFLGIPVSLLALALYIGILGSVVVGSMPRCGMRLRQTAWAVSVVMGLSAGLAAIWFISLQVFHVKHLCTYCLAAHVCGLLIAGVLLWKRPLGGKLMSQLSMISIALFGVLVGGQILIKPVTYKIFDHEKPVNEEESELFEFSPSASSDSWGGQAQRGHVQHGALLSHPGTGYRIIPSQFTTDHFSVSGTRTEYAAMGPSNPVFLLGIGTAIQEQGPPATPDAAEQRQPSSDARPAETNERRFVTLSGGSLKLDVAQWPILGRPDAKYVFVEMLDYTCDHCRRTHAAIAGAKQRLGNDLAVVILPVPLNTKCNNAIASTGARMAEACEIAQLAIAVWRIDPSKLEPFHNYLMTTPSTPTYAESRRTAVQLVGQGKLDAEMAQPIVNQYIAKNVELYRRVGAGSVPKLFFPGRTIVGEYTSADGLVDVIRQQLN